MVWFCSLVLAGEGDPAYLEALAAWNREAWAESLALAESAVAAEPTHRPALLLEGYALFRLHRAAEGVATLAALAELPATSDYERVIQVRAGRLARRWTDRARRDQVAIAVGVALPFERRYDALTPLSAVTVTVQVPLPIPVGVRAEGLLPLAGSGLFDVSGPYVGALAVVDVPVGRGVWSVDGALGPEVWSARGGYWADGGQPYLGARAAVGVDVRAGRRVGLRLQAGTRWYPGVAEDLPWFGVPVDTSLTVVSWWGR